MELYNHSQTVDVWYLDGVECSKTDIAYPNGWERDAINIMDMIEEGRLVHMSTIKSVPNPDLVKIVKAFVDMAERGGCYWKIPAIKLVRSLTGTGLKEAKDFVEKDCGVE